MNSIPEWVRTFPPGESEGWTLTTIERESRYWLTAQVGHRAQELFKRGVGLSWQWAAPGRFIRWFSDGERRYAQELWLIASIRLRYGQVSRAYGHLKVWREGLEVAIKIKGSQGRPRREWLHADHPFTAVSEATEVHANHCEALNSAIRRHCSAYRRRQNHYAKTRSGLQRAITVQQLIHNWIRPHFSLGKKTTPAMKMGFISRPVTMLEFLTTRGYSAITS